MRRLIPLVLLASSLPAQYFDLAVTDDGRLYFSTPLKTGDEDSRLKVFRLTGDRPELFAVGTTDNNPFGNTAGAPLVSGDGSITGWALTLGCGAGSCGLFGTPHTFFQLQGAGLDTLAVNSLQISRNGRFLLAGTTDVRVRLIELPSQRATDLGQSIGVAGPQSVADNGAVLIRDTRTTPVLALYPHDGAPQPVSDSEGALSGILSPAGDRIAFDRNRDGRYELVLAGRVIASTPANPSFRYQPSFSNDGALLYLDPDGQPFLVPPAGEPRRLATLEPGAQRAILSGDGRIAWFATRSGQLLRIHTADATIDEVIPATPYLTVNNVFGLPGSVVRFTGSGITRATRFQLGDTLLPISAVGADLAYVQIPWEYSAALQTRPLTVQGPRSPFRQQFDFFALDRPTITFEREGAALKAAHQDFRGPLTAADPARPGETIHIFAKNLGPVDQPVATGEPSPDPPAHITTPFACYLFEVLADAAVRPRGLVVPFAGLSAGLVGVYHIDVTIPAEWKTSQAQLHCRMDSDGNLFRGDSARFDVDVTPR